MKKHLLALTTLLSFNANAQPSKWAVSAGPVIIGLRTKATMGMQAGVAYELGKHLEILTETAIRFKNNNDSNAINFKYFRVHSELRYHVDDRENKINPYVAIQGGYVFRKWQNIAGGTYAEDMIKTDSMVRYSTATIRSPAIIIASNFGLTANIGKRLCFDFFVGIGARIVQTKYMNVTNAVKISSLYNRTHYAYDVGYETDDKTTGLHINLGCRFLYRL